MKIKAENPIFYVKYICGSLSKIVNILQVNNLYFSKYIPSEYCEFFNDLKELISISNYCHTYNLQTNHGYDCDFEIISEEEYFKLLEGDK